MREAIAILKANIKFGKANFISIFILIFVVSLALTTVVTVNTNSAKRDSEALQEDGFGEFWSAFSTDTLDQNGITIEELTEKLGDCKETGQIKTIDCVFASVKDINGHERNNNNTFMVNGDGGICFQIYEDDGKSFLENPEELQEGEVAVPISFQSMYDCKVGDQMVLDNNGTEGKMTIKYFFEDPFMGSSMMGVKTILISRSDLNTYIEAGIQNSEETIHSGKILNVFMADEVSLSTLKLEQALNEQTNFTAYAYLTLSSSQASSYMLIIVNIFSGILIVFIILLLIVTMIVIGHNISSSIEMEYENIGILKSIGFTAGKLKQIYILQYFIAVLLGSILGIPAAIPVIKLINQITKPVTCLQISDKIAFLPCVLILTVIILLVVLFVWCKFRKLSGVTPMRAIAGGRSTVYFQSRLQLPVKQNGLNFWLAYRQLISNKKQYFSACVITVILVFFLGMVSSLSLWIGDDGQNLNKMFTAFDDEINVVYYDEDVQEDVEHIIVGYTDITEHFKAYSQYMLMNHCQIYGTICDTPAAYNTILEGRTCLYDNEILMTEFLANEFDLNIGDTVTIGSGSYSDDYMVVGLYQCANDTGSNFAMNLDGYKRLTGSVPPVMMDIYALGDDGYIDKIVEAVNEKYDEKTVTIENGLVFESMDSIVAAVKGISAIVYVIAVVFVIITVYIMCGKIFVREQTDDGIYKAIGFTSVNLRIQFAIRFALVATIGSLIGLVLHIYLSQSCASFLFSFMGVSEFHANTGIGSSMIPVIFMIMLFFTFSYLLAGKIKKVETRVLISE